MEGPDGDDRSDALVARYGVGPEVHILALVLLTLRCAQDNGLSDSAAKFKMLQLDLSTFRETRWYEYAARFFFGGLITAAAGIVAKKLGPAIGGLFLAFPAIFPAGA